MLSRVPANPLRFSLCASLVLACGGGAVTPAPAPPLTTVLITPATLQTGMGGTAQFSVEGIWSDGGSAQPAVAWTATGGTVTNAGLYTAGSVAGSFHVVVTAQTAALADTAVITVLAPPPPTLVTLALTPAAVTIETTAAQQFSVSGTWSDASTTTPVVTYSAAGGTITPGGLYTAGTTAGVFRVIAVQQAGTLADTSIVTLAAPTLTALVLAPGSASLTTGASQQFAVSGTWSNGSHTVPAVNYTATGGTVTAGGLYHAGDTAGTFRVIATQRGGTLADTAAITLTAPTLTTLVLAPSSASLATGATQQFTVSGTWSDGSSTTPLVNYSATGGAIAAGGLYTAGATAGTFRVIATHQAGTRADTSTIILTAPGGGLANECATPHIGWVWCDDFEQDRSAKYFEVDNAGGTFTRVAGVGNQGSYGMRIQWAAGQQNGGSLHLALGKTPQSYFKAADAGTAIYRELYWRIYVKHQAGWTGGGGDKLTRAFVYASPTTWAQAAAGHVWSGMGSNENNLEIDPYRGTDAVGNMVTTGFNDFAHFTYLGADEGSIPMFDAAHVGNWYCVEAHMKLNDAGQSNGVFEVWVNGSRDASKTGLNWLGSFNTYGINALFFENFWNAGAAKAEARYFDNIVVSTARVGC